MALSTGTIIGLVVGGIVVLGGAIYFGTRSSPSTPSEGFQAYGPQSPNVQQQQTQPPQSDVAVVTNQVGTTVNTLLNRLLPNRAEQDAQENALRLACIEHPTAPECVRRNAAAAAAAGGGNPREASGAAGNGQASARDASVANRS